MMRRSWTEQVEKVYLIPFESRLVCVVGVPPPFGRLCYVAAIGKHMSISIHKCLPVSSLLDRNAGLGGYCAGQGYTV